MNVEFVSVTEPNLANVEGDSLSVFDGMGTFAENLCEYAGRVCYKSTTKMGHAPNFLRDRIREGHEDIIEHVVVTVMFQSELDDFFTNSFGLHKLCVVNRHCEMSGNEWSGEAIRQRKSARLVGFFPALNAARRSPHPDRYCAVCVR